MKFSLMAFALLFFISIQSQAQRTVVLTSHGPGSPIQITNPSTVGVNFDVACFDAAGTQTVNQTGLSLASQNTHFVGGPTCAAGYTLEVSSSSFSSPIYACKKDSGTVTFANAAAVCSGNNLCTIQEVVLNHGTNAYSNFAYWFVPGVTNWSYDNTGSGAFTNVTDGTGTRSIVTASNFTPRCKDVVAASGAPNVQNCKERTVGFGAAGSLCCESQTGLSYCRVTITSTSADAYLTSPNFKGGAPF